MVQTALKKIGLEKSFSREGFDTGFDLIIIFGDLLVGNIMPDEIS